MGVRDSHHPALKYKPTLNGSRIVYTLPPILLFASIIVTSCPASFNKEPATNPEIPAPAIVIRFGLFF